MIEKVNRCPKIYQLILVVPVLFICLVEPKAGPAFKSGQISGTITDHNSHAIEYANIGLYDDDENLVSGAISKSDGSFVIDGLSMGQYVLKVMFVGFEPYESSLLQITNDDPMIDVQTIILEPRTEEIDEVEVLGQRKPVVYKLDKKVVDAAAYPNASGGTAVDILENVPSVTVDLEGNVSLRGSADFTVFINGKPSMFQGADALEQIPAGQIDNIEIITNPSARYDAEGTAGIINIILKKETANGITGLVNVNGSTTGSYGADFLFTKKTDRWYWKAGGNHTRNYRKGDFEQFKSTFANDTLGSFFSEGDRTGHFENTSGMLGFGYEDRKNSFEVELGAGIPGFGYNGNLMYTENYVAGNEQIPYREGSYNSHDYKHMSNDIYSANINYTRKLKGEGHKLSMNIYGNYNYALEYFENDLLDFNDIQDDGQKSWEDEYRVTVRAKADYERPLFSNNGKFEAGYLYDLYLEDGDYTLHDFNATLGEFVNMEDYYSRYLLKRHIHAMYGIVSDKSGMLSYQFGLRTEYADRILESSSKWAENIKSAFDFFPSGHVSLQPGEFNQLSASYSRRIERARLHYLEPFITFADSYTARTGNPFVRNEYINSYEISWQRDLKESDFFSVELFHRAKSDKIERIRTIYRPGITLDSISNVGNDYSTGAEAMANIALFSWWTLNASASLYHYSIVSDYKIPGVDDESLNWQLRFSNMLTLNSTTKIQLDGNYVGPSVSTQGTREAFFYTNLSIRKQFFKRKVTGTISASDILRTAEYRNTQTGNGMETITKVVPFYPAINFSLSFRINQYNQKNRQAGPNDDLFEGSEY